MCSTTTTSGSQYTSSLLCLNRIWNSSQIQLLLPDSGFPFLCRRCFLWPPHGLRQHVLEVFDHGLVLLLSHFQDFADVSSKRWAKGFFFQLLTQSNIFVTQCLANDYLQDLRIRYVCLVVSSLRIELSLSLLPWMSQKQTK